MKRWLLGVGVVAVFAGMVGCFPEKRVVWSPDGRWAAILGGDGLRLSDDAGNLSEWVVAGVKRAAWLPDSKQLVAVRGEKVRTWDEVAVCFAEQRRAELVELAAQVQAAALEYEGDWDEFEPDVCDDLSDAEKAAVGLCLRDRLSRSLPEKVTGLWKKIQDWEVEVWSLQVIEVDAAGARPGRLLHRSLGEMLAPRVSPDGAAVAFVGPDPEDEELPMLYVASIAEPGSVHAVARRVAYFPDWAADSREVVFAQADSESVGELSLGSINRVRVRDEAGALLAEPESRGELAGVVFQPEIRIRCLRDGRIVFSAMEITLPCAMEDLPQQATLFTVDPQRSPLVTRLIPRQAENELPDGMYFFEVSPDERQISVPGIDGELAVLTLATGDVWTLFDEDAAADELRTVPTWRQAGELCAAIAPEEGGQHANVALIGLDWSKREMRVRPLSAEWPDEVIQGFLAPEAEKKDDKGAAGEEPHDPGSP